MYNLDDDASRIAFVVFRSRQDGRLHWPADNVLRNYFRGRDAVRIFGAVLRDGFIFAGLFDLLVKQQRLTRMDLNERRDRRGEMRLEKFRGFRARLVDRSFGSSYRHLFTLSTFASIILFGICPVASYFRTSSTVARLSGNVGLESLVTD